MIKNICIVILIGVIGFQYWESHKKITFDEKIFREVVGERFKNRIEEDPFNPYICLSLMMESFENDALSQMGATLPRFQLDISWARMNVVSDEIAASMHKIVEEQVKIRNQKLLSQ